MGFKTDSDWANELRVTQDTVPERVRFGSYECKAPQWQGRGCAGYVAVTTEALSKGDGEDAIME